LPKQLGPQFIPRLVLEDRVQSHFGVWPQPRLEREVIVSFQRSDDHIQSFARLLAQGTRHTQERFCLTAGRTLSWTKRGGVGGRVVPALPIVFHRLARSGNERCKADRKSDCSIQAQPPRIVCERPVGTQFRILFQASQLIVWRWAFDSSVSESRRSLAAQHPKAQRALRQTGVRTSRVRKGYQ